MAPSAPELIPSMSASGSALLSINSSAHAESYVNLVAAFLEETGGLRSAPRTWSMSITAQNLSVSYLSLLGM